MSAGKEYLAKNEVKKMLVEAVTKLMESTPEDPSAFLAEHFGKLSGHSHAGEPGAGINCWDASPDSYKILAENASGKLVQMTLKAGAKDEPHDHTAHYMYVVTGGNLKIYGHGEEKEVTMPSGAAFMLPAGPHQVENIGDNDVEILFMEVTGKLGETPADHTSPLETDPDCYNILFEDEDWFIGKMKLAPGTNDHAHSHRDHLVYVVAGESISIYPGEGKEMEMGEMKMDLALAPGAALPVPQGWHIVKNTGSIECEMIFWELKK